MHCINRMHMPEQWSKLTLGTSYSLQSVSLDDDDDDDEGNGAYDSCRLLRQIVDVDLV